MNPTIRIRRRPGRNGQRVLTVADQEYHIRVFYLARRSRWFAVAGHWRSTGESAPDALSALCEQATREVASSDLAAG